MKTEHAQQELFQTVGNQIFLDVSHAVVVNQGSSLRGANTIPDHRIYAVTATDGVGGTIRNLADGMCLDLTAGGIYFMPGMQPLEYSFESGLCMTAFHFRATLGRGVDLFHGQARFACTADRPELAQEMRCALEGAARPGAMVRGRAILMEMVAGFMAHSTVELRRLQALHARYAPLFERIDEACTARLRVSELAACMHITPSALARNFRRDVGTSVKAVISQRLVQRASQELLLSDRSIKEIAYALEFANEFYFSRFFKRHTHTSPSAFRNAYR